MIRTRKVFTPRARFQFTSGEACKKAQKKVHETHPRLMTSVATEGSVYYLFVQSVRSQEFDSDVKNLVKSYGGKFLGMIV